VIFCIQVFSIFGDYICISIQVLNKWYQNNFLGRHCGQIFLFLHIFFFCEKEDRAIPEIFGIFM
jgi:hypothetical protein